jgi:hypothetical protein
LGEGERAWKFASYYPQGNIPARTISLFGMAAAMPVGIFSLSDFPARMGYCLTVEG